GDLRLLVIEKSDQGGRGPGVRDAGQRLNGSEIPLLGSRGEDRQIDRVLERGVVWVRGPSLPGPNWVGGLKRVHLCSQLAGLGGVRELDRQPNLRGRGLPSFRLDPSEVVPDADRVRPRLVQPAVVVERNGLEVLFAGADLELLADASKVGDVRV